jgi:hypothetical protein
MRSISNRGDPSHAVVILSVWPNGNAEAAIAGGASDCCPGPAGSFLVQSVPEPSSLLLLGCGLLGLAAWRWKWVAWAQRIASSQAAGPAIRIHTGN